jgi:hypothetical protein
MSSSQLAFYNLHGYYITSAAYIMRPGGAAFVSSALLVGLTEPPQSLNQTCKFPFLN